jgi:hypothetical protein
VGILSAILAFSNYDKAFYIMKFPYEKLVQRSMPKRKNEAGCALRPYNPAFLYHLCKSCLLN